MRRQAKSSNLSHRSGGRAAPLLALMLLAVPLGGCNSLDFFSKLFPDKNAQINEPADKLYNQGLYYLNEKKDFAEAAKKFEEVDRQHPYSEWARKALLMDAYTLYSAARYTEAIAAAKRYVSLHPGSSDASYAHYLIGASYFDQIPDVSRDQQNGEKAMAALDEVARKYPDTEYAVSARRKIEFARDQLAGREMEIGRYYLQRRDFTGAINRFKVVVTRYQTTRHVEEALMRLTEAYMSIGIVPEAQTAAAVLGHNFPDSRWYQDAYKLVKSGGLEPRENKESWISRAFKSVGLG
jgi:outer membrane protein assembly factor BamD